jgi:hypothetical protein
MDVDSAESFQIDGSCCESLDHEKTGDRAVVRHRSRRKRTFAAQKGGEIPLDLF